MGSAGQTVCTLVSSQKHNVFDPEKLRQWTDKCASQDKYLDMWGWWTSQSRSLGWPSSPLQPQDTGKQLKKTFPNTHVCCKIYYTEAKSPLCVISLHWHWAIFKEYSHTIVGVISWWISHFLCGRAAMMDAHTPGGVCVRYPSMCELDLLMVIGKCSSSQCQTGKASEAIFK